MAIELSDELIKLEEAAWAEIQAGALTVDTAAAVQAAITEHAQAAGEDRFKLEAALKKHVRHPDA
ncbi:hypothetical protein [Streptomyces nymphaeiformis]|uniref:Uncharacterized protein n=1 Tax=Streptomyces nymphaeiformis TaxID=2663842 RepID=A0A7W7U4Z8_9ACTN|nr:hypothetical protein [Streptomyces nymphaeiformis]MBB4985049.1 hypothetical protein [Streptomyces nymphaeiformis]